MEEQFAGVKTDDLKKLHDTLCRVFWLMSGMYKTPESGPDWMIDAIQFTQDIYHELWSRRITGHETVDRPTT